MADGDAGRFIPKDNIGIPIPQWGVRDASEDLLRRRPEWSCSNKVRHASSLVTAFIIAGTVGLLDPGRVLAGFNFLLIGWFTLLIAMRAALIFVGARARLQQSEPSCAERESWPVYSVLVPLYREAATVPKLVHALKNIDYPTEQLDVIFLTEQDDTDTRAALRRLVLPEHWPILVLPDGQPRTKPRALNVALQHLKGRFVTIYDAEDCPHPSQLKTAVCTLEAAGEDMACAQAPLEAYNARASWIAGQWALEYDTHFGLILPALAKAERPIALGGTSNHFRVSAVRKAGGWDAWNVTEDADLGLRFARLGYRVGTIAPPTLEEAPETLSVWVPQRSRWIKGYMQSAAVILRRPRLAMEQMGTMSFLASQVLLGGAILSAGLHGPMAIACLVCLLVPGVSLSPACISLLAAGYGLNFVAAMLAPGRKDLRRLWLMMTAIFYWPLQTLGAIRALYELTKSPHMWAKTPHGLTQAEPF